MGLPCLLVAIHVSARGHVTSELQERRSKSYLSLLQGNFIAYGWIRRLADRYIARCRPRQWLWNARHLRSTSSGIPYIRGTCRQDISNVKDDALA